jgi:uncharacterized membrane protein YoaK (UPF0700 family)
VVPISSISADAIAASLATALGLQNAFVRRLAVPDLTTTVLTMTLTGLAADRPDGDATVLGRRLLAVASMLAGAVAGALLVLRVNPSAALAFALVLMSGVFIASLGASRSTAGWQS